MNQKVLLWSFIVLSVCFGLDPQAAQAGMLVSQSPSTLSVKPGADVLVNCSFKLRVAEAFIDWKQGNVTLVTCKIRQAKDCCTVPEDPRFNVSVDWKTQISTLQIRNVELKDDKVYYCHLQREKPLPIKQGQGDGTNLTIDAQDERSPDLYKAPYWTLTGLLVAGMPLCVLCIRCLLLKGNRPGARSGSQEGGEGDDDCTRPKENKLLMMNQWPAGETSYSESTVQVGRSESAQPTNESGSDAIYSQICHSTTQRVQTLYEQIGS